ncbi:hypothetical protein GCM10009555_051410 [Acrocarpospora macrocephala]|uniref:Uncharacterized protein n=1 Tax=Acrocarpospora macrocephala TaxID=150177 RepID=A0A5M3X4S0_9ACTN|nr:hypothetical protein [Acrocarpospora macrocephala]GES16705.1 hypothetical protein Amac_103030 [Acrocarpospora macrocephala]
MIRRIALSIAALAAGATVLTVASPAHALAGWGGTLTPGSTACVGQYAATKVQGDGTATAGGAKFFIYRAGVLAYATPGRVTGWVQGLTSTSVPAFPGAGDYTVCAKNTGSANTLVNFHIASDNEF